MTRTSTVSKRLMAMVLAVIACPLASTAARSTPGEASVNLLIANTRAVRDIALAPDGETVAAVITDTTSEGGHGHLWLLSPDEVPRQISGLDKDAGSEDGHPAWSGDGAQLYYVAKVGDAVSVRRYDRLAHTTTTLSLQRADGGVDAVWDDRLVGERLQVRGISPSPTSGTIAVWAADPDPMIRLAETKQDDHVFGETETVRLYLVDGDEVRSVPLPDDVDDAVWQDDGARMLVLTRPPSDDLGVSNALWLVETGRKPERLEAVLPTIDSVAWAEGGQEIAYLAQCEHDTPTVCRDLYVQSIAGGVPRNLSAGIEGSIVAGPIATRSDAVYVLVARGFGQQVARFDWRTGRMDWMTGLPKVVKALATNRRTSAFAMLAADSGGPVSARIAGPDLRVAVPLPSPPLQPAGWGPLAGRPVSWRNEGLTIEGLFYRPVGVPGPVPLIINVHGGPAGRFEDSDYPLVRLLLAQGWAVLHVNPRGSLGYGAPFLASNRDDLGGADYRDIISGLDHVLAREKIDPDRLAMIGFSYGGEMVAFAQGRTEKFKALVSAAPVIEQFSEYGSEESSWYDRWYFGKPWRRFGAAWRQSPLSGVKSSRTRFLLLHGEADTIDPPEQSKIMLRALRQEGVPSQLVLYPRQSHRELGLNFYGWPSVEPHHGIAMRSRLVEFISDAFAGKCDLKLESCDE